MNDQLARRMQAIVSSHLARTMCNPSTASNVRSEPSDILTKEKLDHLLDTILPLKPRFAAFVIRPEVEAQLRVSFASEDAMKSTLMPPYAGIPIFSKNNQRSQALAFASLQQARDYLDDKITEEQLLATADQTYNPQS